MKIALIRHMMDDPQGGARLVALLARDLHEMGEEVTLYCYGYDQAGCFADVLAEVPVKCVRRLDSSTRGRHGFETGWRRSWAQLRRYYSEAPAIASLIDPHTKIVNAHEWPAHRSAALFGLPRGVPIVWAYNDPSHWHLHSGWGPRDLPYRALGWLDTRFINRFAMVTTLSRWMADVAERAFTAPVQMIRCGVDIRSIPTRHVGEAVSDGGPSVVRLLSVGILAPWRRFEDVIRAVAAAREQGCECRCEIIGSERFWPSYGTFLRQVVTALGLRGAVELRLESVTDAELEQAYARADVAVFPNEQQAWGLAQLEAMARGVPVVVSRGAGVSEVLTEGENALLVDPRCPDQIAAAIARLARNPGLGRALGAAGRRLVRESYTSGHYAERMLRLFRASLGGQ